LRLRQHGLSDLRRRLLFFLIELVEESFFPEVEGKARKVSGRATLLPFSA